MIHRPARIGEQTHYCIEIVDKNGDRLCMVYPDKHWKALEDAKEEALARAEQIITAINGQGGKRSDAE